MNKQSAKYISPTKPQGAKPSNGLNVNTSRESTRRVWIRRPEGTATSLYVKQDQIVDDLKSMVMEKFPMTLAKMFDPSDVSIRLEPSLTSSTPVGRKLTAPSGYPSTSPSSFTSPISPIPIAARKSSLIPPRIPSNDYSSSGRSISPASQIQQTSALEPDRSIWAILDQYYPQGMTMENAFIVDTPTNSYQMGATIPIISQRKSVSNETIVEGREEEYQTSVQRRMKSVSSVPSNRPNTPGSLHRRSQSNPAEHASAVLLMPSNSKASRSHSTTQTVRLQSESPERLMSPTDSSQDQYSNNKKNSGTSQLRRSNSPCSRITNGTSTMAKVLPSVNVLIVEDNLINLRILSAHLRRHRIHYDVAKNGQEAIDKWRKGGFHLVLMDIQLPVMSGLDASKEIRRLEKLNHIGVFSALDLQNLPPKKPEEELDVTVFRSPVIIVALTASNLIQDKQQALAAGCNDYLTKPVDLDWLLNKITEWGCMQALIDFDGWKSGERMTNISAALPSLTRNTSARRAPVIESTGKY